LPKKSPNASNYDRSWLFTRRSCCSVRVNFLSLSNVNRSPCTYTVKRKWERIVNRGFEKSQSPPDAVSRTPSNAITNPVVAGLTGPAVLEGIKEGMHRFLAAGLSITDPNSTPSSPSPLSASPLPPLSGQRSSPLSAERSSPLSGGPTTQRWRRTHARERESLSSVSTHATATSPTTRYSQCSSSTAASSLGSKEAGGDDDVGEGQKPLGESDNFCAAPELMVHDTGATPTTSPSPAFECTERQQQCAVEPQQPIPGEPQPQGEPDEEEEFDETTFTSSLDLTPSGGAKVRRRKSKDVVPLHWSSGLSAIEPGSTLTANTTTASSVGSSRVPLPLSELEGTVKVEGGSSGREKTNGNMRATIHMNGHGHGAQTNGRVGGGVNGVGSLPPPSSIPGLGVLTGGGASWMNNVGKKLGELRDSPTYVFFDWILSLGEPVFRSQRDPRSQFDLVPLASFFPFLVPHCNADIMYFCIQLHQKSKTSIRATIGCLPKLRLCMERSHHTDRVSSTNLTSAELT